MVPTLPPQALPFVPDDDALARARAFVAPKAERPRRVVVAMSGGVDSAVAAWLLVQQGHEVIGVSLRLAPDPPEQAPHHGPSKAPDTAHRGEGGSGRCCSIDDMTDARRTADALGIPFHAVDMRDRFRAAVLDPFVRAYRAGLTPIPCLACNHDVKVGGLLETARALGAALATGHYARIVRRGDGLALARPIDRRRDQTYWLYGTPHADLADLELPLGDLDKPLVRALAARAGIRVAHKPDSQEICFVPDGDHARVVERESGPLPGGELVHIGGRRLARHDGVHRFTVGQRRGTGVAAGGGEKLYVVDVDAASGVVTLGPRDALAVTRVRAAPLRLAQPLDAWPTRIDVQVRARHAPQRARFELVGDGVLEIVFDSPVHAVALGQAAVCYDGDVLLGGGLLVERCDGAAPRALTGA
jgi:tRNA-specific 2-thiouridylase